MFSGIIEDQAEVIEFDSDSSQLSIRSSLDFSDSRIGDSVAVNGTCLTLTELSAGNLKFDVLSETLRRTNLGTLRKGVKVNVERSLKAGDRIHGHFVTGHIDAVAAFRGRHNDGSGWRYDFERPQDLARFIISKGSITLNGVSLTIGEVSANSFCVYIIPHTAANTNLGNIAEGELVNLEVDILARYVSGQREVR